MLSSAIALTRNRQHGVQYPVSTTAHFGFGIAGVDEPSINLPRYTWPDVISSVMTWFYMQYISTFLEYAGVGGGIWYFVLYLSFVQQLYGDPDGASHLSSRRPRRQ